MPDAGKLQLTEGDAAATPSAGNLRIYAKTDHELYVKDPNGNERGLGTSGTAYFATSAGNAGSASSATTAGNAGSAGSATTAAQSGTSSYSTTSGQAGTAAYATTAGQAGTALSVQAPLTNLLTNTDWIANSGSTAENVGSQLVASWANSDYDTFTSTAENITSAIYSTAGTQNADTASITIVSGKLYKIIATLTLNSGQAPTLTGTGGVTTTTLSAGANTITFEATAAATILTMTNTAASNYSCTFTLFEITPGYVAAGTLAPDGWKKTNSAGSVYREHSGSNTKDGSFYSLKFVTTGDHRLEVNVNGGQAENYKKLNGRSLCIGAWVKTSTASAVRLATYDSVNSYRYSSYHSGGGDWEWLEYSFTPSASSTGTGLFYFAVNNTTAYLSQPIAVFGSSIGQGNYAPIPGEVIRFQQDVDVLSNYTLAINNTSLNLEALSSGQIGKGIQSIKGLLFGTNTAAGEQIYLYPTTGAILSAGQIVSQVANVRITNNIDAVTDSSGDIVINGSDGDWTAVYLRITAIQT